MDNFAFVVGCPRSGTTLLRAMLDSHPELAIPGESYFVVELAPAFRRRWWRRFDRDAFASAVCGHERFQQWGLADADVRAALTSAAPTSYADAVRVVYGLYARRHGKARYGDKTPNYVLQLPLLAELFPEARFVHIVRDGRDVALSVTNIDEWGPKRVPGAAKYWVQHVGAGRDAGAALGPARYLDIRYEDLVAEPERVLRSVCEFLDLEFDDAMLTYYERFDEVIAPDLLPQYHQRLREPPKVQSRWRTEMTEADREAFEAHAGPLLAAYSYPTGRASIGDK
ncbi:MAG: sulfotransferase, partial [Actinomycetia bacterium]|nr:sulfotransferase [Actinomycetes bacterium]